MDNILHIYAQRKQHSEAFIAGNRHTLLIFINKIKEAIEGGKGKFTSFINDGEGFDCHIMCLDDEKMNEMIQPYTDTESTCPSGKSPYDLIEEQIYG
jgi:hypothetical protein